MLESGDNACKALTNLKTWRGFVCEKIAYKNRLLIYFPKKRALALVISL